MWWSGSHAFDDRGRCHAAARAEGHQPGRKIAPLEFIEQGPDQDRAGSANRMTQRDRSSSDIHLCMIDVELTHEFQRHHRERLIDFEQIDEIGRASCRERVCQYVYVSVVAVSLKKTKAKT